MTDKERIERLYRDMYAAMVEKDRDTLWCIHDDSFELVHMTGMRQPKQVCTDSIPDGTLNYYAAEQDSLDVMAHGDKARMIGHSRVTAAAFGGGIHTRRLALDFTLKKTDGAWKFTHAAASIY